MTEQDILQLRDLAEAGQVQFKERIVNKDDKYEIGCEMVAFSNSRGGRLIIGINDKSGEINALSYQELQETTNLLTNIASENVIPNVLIEVENTPVTGGAVVIATIPEGKNKPYHDNKGVIWVKNGADKRKVFDNAELAEMMSECGAGSGVRRAIEYDPNVIFSNGVDQREITHSANEFVITIPRKSNQANDQVTDQAPQNTTKLAHETDPVNDQAPLNTTKLAHNTNPISDQAPQNTTKLKLSKKQQDITEFLYHSSYRKGNLAASRSSRPFRQQKEIHLRISASRYSGTYYSG